MSKAGYPYDNAPKEVAGNTFTDYTYDKSGNQTYEISQPGVSGNAYTIAEGSIVTSSEYDDAGNVVLETDGKGVKTKYAYDDENRITDIYLDYEDENTPVSLHANYSISEDGVTTTVLTDANGNTKTEQTDAAGNIIMTEDSEADDTGEKITVRNEYDELRRLNQTDYSDGSFIIYTYDGNSDRVTIKEAYKGGDLESKIETEYDDKERPFMITCRDASKNIRYNTVYDYTAEGSVSEIRTTDTSGNTDTTQYGYDSEGRLAQKSYPSATGLGTVSYQYDVAGHNTRISDSDGIIREYTYNGLGQVTSVRDYDKPGSNTSILKTYTYDAHGRTVTMVYTKNTAGGDLLESFGYSYDKNSNIVSGTHIRNISDNISRTDETRQYVYDNKGNLTQSTKTDNLNEGAQEITSYEYDAVGNRLTETVGTAETSYVYNGLNQLVEKTSPDTETSYTYDARGNQILEESIETSEEVAEEDDEDAGTTSGATADLTAPIATSISTEYAVTGEMIKLEKTSQGQAVFIQENEYNQDGQRVSRTENGTTRSYYYDNGAVAFTRDGNSVSSANILSTSGATIGTYRGSTYYGYLKDVQGSTSSIVKEDGELFAAYDYTDFGETEELTGSSFDNEICYTGAIYDKETGLYYMNARYYNPDNGRFISQDSFRGEMNDPGQWHLYAYCANNPINYTDPSGHFLWKVVGAVIVGTAAYKLGKSYGLKGWKLALCTAVGAGIGGLVGHFVTPLLRPVLYIFVNWGRAAGAVSKVGKFKIMFHWKHHGKGYHVVLQKLKTKRWRTVYEKGFKPRK